MNMEERIQFVSQRWFISEPLLFMTLMSHEIVPNKGLRHIIRSGQGRIEYNYDYDTETLSDAELEENLRAEVMRILLRHPYRHHGKKDTAYMASNITLNENYKFQFLKYKAREIWPGSEYAHYNQKNFEFYYREILKMEGTDGGSDLTEKGESTENVGSDLIGTKKSTESGSSDLTEKEESAESGDSDLTEKEEPTESGSSEQNDLTECSALWQEDNFMDEKIKEIIEWACENMHGGTFSDNFMQTLYASLRPEIDYRKILNAFRATVLSSDKMLTRFKPSRRYGFLYMGKKNEFTTNLLVAVDVSGSMSDNDLKTFFAAINQFFKYGIKSLDVLQIDAEIKGPVLTLKRAEKKVKVLGRGGNNFQPLIKYFEKSKKKYDGLIIFTDGYAPIPKMSASTIRKTIWICACKEDYEVHKKWMEQHGKCCWIKEW